MYNPYNPEANIFDSVLSSFKLSLAAEKISNGSIRSYLSDTRHFLSWLQSFLASHGFSQILKTDSHGSAPIGQISENPLGIRENLVLLKQVNVKVLEAYQEHLKSSNTPLKSINRSFSSLRKFGSFCQSQNWSVKNPFDALRNISPNQPFPETDYHLAEFKTYLWKNSSSKLTIKNYLNDVKQFLSWKDLHGLRADFRGSDSVDQISANQFKNPRKSLI